MRRPLIDILGELRNKLVPLTTLPGLVRADALLHELALGAVEDAEAVIPLVRALIDEATAHAEAAPPATLNELEAKLALSTQLARAGASGAEMSSYGREGRAARKRAVRDRSRARRAASK